ncbi:uncharacterized protein LOC132040938 [Lycium ferocissimum]|uniref:uncharacterized protein LOC132040938 n=1 Tax=Lycium ferocissimum TaxID=112874 RepID=UPI002816311C|nr:uncharacterized protein LOC132040938 [Lycium ferocissimum]
MSQESFDHKFLEDGSADNPPVTAEASEFEHLSILLMPRRANQSTESSSHSRLGLDSVKGEAVTLEEKFRQLESERDTEKEAVKVAQEKVETRVRANKKLKTDLEAAIRDNDGLQAELVASNHVRITLSNMRSELEENLKKAQDDLKEAHDEVEAAEARSILLVEHEKWKSRRSMLEAAQQGLSNIPTRIAEAKDVEDRAKRALEDSFEEGSNESDSDDSGSSSAD